LTFSNVPSRHPDSFNPGNVPANSMKALIVTIIVAGIAHLSGVANAQHGYKDYFKAVAKRGDVVVEIRGSVQQNFPTEAWTVSRSTGEETFLAMPETYIESAAISDDAKYIVLSYHISSGGYGEAFARTRNGRYRKMCENGYAYQQIMAGKVADSPSATSPGDRTTSAIFCLSDVRRIACFSRWAIAWSLPTRCNNGRSPAGGAISCAVNFLQTKAPPRWSWPSFLAGEGSR
jgi:hypothetical protein